jgi:hypothetical protein
MPFPRIPVLGRPQKWMSLSCRKTISTDYLTAIIYRICDTNICGERCAYVNYSSVRAPKEGMRARTRTSYTFTNHLIFIIEASGSSTKASEVSHAGLGGPNK